MWTPPPIARQPAITKFRPTAPVVIFACARQRAGSSGYWERAPAASGTPELEPEAKQAVWNKWLIFCLSERKLKYAVNPEFKSAQNDQNGKSSNAVKKIDFSAGGK